MILEEGIFSILSRDPTVQEKLGENSACRLFWQLAEQEEQLPYVAFYSSTDTRPHSFTTAAKPTISRVLMTFETFATNLPDAKEIDKRIYDILVIWSGEMSSPDVVVQAINHTGTRNAYDDFTKTYSVETVYEFFVTLT